jgi:hypothetical protein
MAREESAVTAVIDVTIECDTCGHRGLTRRRAAFLVRARLAHDGWHRYNGVDICPSCWHAGARGPKTRGQWARRRTV